VDVRLFRRILVALLGEFPRAEGVDLGVCLVADAEMIRLNEQFARHAGATDVIAFDYAERTALRVQSSSALHGEIFICMDEALRQARRFRTRWQSELVRYLVHGLLHLHGFDDRHAAQRRVLRREENRLLRRVAARFPLSRLERKTRLPA